MKYGPWAVIAGASEGIGAAFARALAAQGIKLVLVARREAPLRELAASLPVETRVVALDLATDAHSLAEHTADLDVGLVVCNAALSTIAPFTEAPLADLLRAIDLNCRAPLVLAHTFLRRFKARGNGGFIAMSSLAGLYGGPFVATYAASKAFEIVLCESLAKEMPELDVLACIAGPTDTPTYRAQQPTSFPAPMRAEDVVRDALNGLGKTSRVIPGAFHRATSALVSLLPRSAVLAMVARQTRRYRSH